MNDFSDVPPTDGTEANDTQENTDNNFRDRIEEFLKLCETLRDEAVENGLDKQQFNMLMASVLQQEEQETELRSALHTARVEEFLQTCRALRDKAVAQGMSKDNLDVELIAAMMDNQARFEGMREKKEKDKEQQMMQGLLGKINPNKDGGQSR